MENTDFVIPRISKFEPPNGAPSVNKAWNSFQKFIDTCFDNGEYITEQTATPSKDACRWCKFKDKKELCSVGITK